MFKFNNGAIELILAKGYSREFGLRNMQRMFQEIVLLPVIDWMNAGKKTGGKESNIIKVNEKAGTLYFS